MGGRLRLEYADEHRPQLVLIAKNHVSDGYIALWDAKRLDLTVEAFIVDNAKYHVLFDDQELEICRARLADYEYSIDGD